MYPAQIIRTLSCNTAKKVGYLYRETLNKVWSNNSEVCGNIEFFVKKNVWPVDPVIFLLQNITFTYSIIQHDCRHLHSDWPREACRNCLRDAHADWPRDAHADWLRYSQADRLRDIWLMKIYHIACKNYFIYLLLFCVVLCSGFVFVFHFSYNYN